MALTETRPRRLLEPTHQPEETRVATSRDGSPNRISFASARRLSAAWVIGFLVSMLIEPAPAAEASEPAWVVAAGVVLLGAIVATLAGLAVRARWAAVTSLAGASILMAGVIACPVTGHHAIGAWWVAQLAIATGLLALSGSALLRRSA